MRPRADGADARRPRNTNKPRLWKLGRHRLLCGDATCAADVDELVGRRRVLVMVTDPPYGVNYEPEWRAAVDGRPSRNLRILKPLNDERCDWTDAYKLFRGDVAYVWHAGLFARDTCGHLRDAGFAVRAQIVWRKRRPVFSRGHYHWQHEPCWYAVRKGRTADWSGGFKQRTVWDVATDPVLDVATVHSTQKPVEVMLRAMRNHGRPGTWVYDPFVGSGSSIIAAEVCGRRCLAMELSREFCSIVVRRWEAFTGRRAEVIA